MTILGFFYHFYLEALLTDTGGKQRQERSWKKKNDEKEQYLLC